LVLVLLAVCTRSTLAAEPDAAALIARLARPAPANTRFVEARFSSLLARPLVVSGQLTYLSPDHLVRRVDEPFRELMTIRGEEVVVERDGEQPVRFSLKRAPELLGMLSSFGALLAGDRTLLDRHFRSSLSGDDVRWRLVLTPTSDRVRQKLGSIHVEVERDAVRCFTLVEPDGDSSFMLLGDTAPATRPEPLERGWLEALCSGVAP
jgi:hypothetical protein